MSLTQILAAIVAARDEGDEADDGPAEAASLRVAGRVCCVPHSADAFNDDTVYATELAAWLRRAFLPVAGGNAAVRAVLATPAAATDDGTPIIWEVEVPVAGSSASGDLAPSTPLSVALDWAGVVETAHDDAAARSIELELLQLLASWAIEAAPKPSLFGAPPLIDVELPATLADDSVRLHSLRRVIRVSGNASLTALCPPPDGANATATAGAVSGSDVVGGTVTPSCCVDQALLVPAANASTLRALLVAAVGSRLETCANATITSSAAADSATCALLAPQNPAAMLLAVFANGTNMTDPAIPCAPRARATAPRTRASPSAPNARRAKACRPAAA